MNFLNIINIDDRQHKNIKEFNPDVTQLKETHQDLLYKLQLFDAGNKYTNFNDFIKNEAEEYAKNGDGATYLVWDVQYDVQTNHEISRELVAYYTIGATAIPYIDRIRKDETEIQETGEIYDIETCGISALEIKMFAVDIKYQDVFYAYENESLPVSAWVLQKIIDFANSFLVSSVGFKALLLHSVPEAENFYLINGFSPLEINMEPLHSVDSDFIAMYLPLREVQMNYDN